jgi:uncharacterized membrane protein
MARLYIEIGAYTPEERRTIFGLLREIRKEVRELREEVKALMKTQQDLDAAVAQEVLDVADVATKVNNLAAADATAFADLQAKIAANPTAPVSDFTDEVNQLAGNHTSLAAASAALATALTTTQTNDPGQQAAAGTGDAGSTGDIPTIGG